MSTNIYTIEIHMSRLNTIIEERNIVPFPGYRPGQGDNIKYTKQKITITAERTKKFDPIDILRNKQNSIYAQIFKSLLYLYLKNERRIYISSIVIKRSTSRTEDVPYVYGLDKYSQPISNDFQLGVTLSAVVLDKVFEENASGNSFRMASSHWLRGKSSTDRYFKFERYWRTFERLSIYHIRTAQKINDFEAMCSMRDYIIANNDKFTRSLTNVSSISGLKFRKFEWDLYIESEFPEATTANPRLKCYQNYKNNFVCANHDLRIIGMHHKLLHLRSASLSINGMLADVQSHIATQLAARDTRQDEVLSILMCRYAYYLRNKMFHAERADFTFTFTDKTHDDSRIDILNNIFDRIITDMMEHYTSL